MPLVMLPLSLQTTPGFERARRLGVPGGPAHSVEGVGGEFPRLARRPTPRAALPDLRAVAGIKKPAAFEQLTNQPP